MRIRVISEFVCNLHMAYYQGITPPLRLLGILKVGQGFFLITYIFSIIYLTCLPMADTCLVVYLLSIPIINEKTYFINLSYGDATFGSAEEDVYGSVP